jgi:hypothetical protein
MQIEKDIGTTNKAQQVLNVIWPLIGTRTAPRLLLLGLAASRMAFNWGWFVAVGIAPIILSILSCAVTCGLGLCMQPGKKGRVQKNSELSC